MASAYDNNETIDKDQYNNQISAQIAELENKKNAYQRVKDKALNLLTSLDSLAINADLIGNSLEAFIIAGKSLDDGCFKELATKLKSILDSFSKIASVCKSKINEIDSQIGSLKAQYK